MRNQEPPSVYRYVKWSGYVRYKRKFLSNICIFSAIDDNDPRYTEEDDAHARLRRTRRMSAVIRDGLHRDIRAMDRMGELPGPRTPYKGPGQSHTSTPSSASPGFMKETVASSSRAGSSYHTPASTYSSGKSKFLFS